MGGSGGGGAGFMTGRATADFLRVYEEVEVKVRKKAGADEEAVQGVDANDDAPAAVAVAAALLRGLLETPAPFLALEGVDGLRRLRARRAAARGGRAPTRPRAGGSDDDA